MLSLPPAALAIRLRSGGLRGLLLSRRQPSRPPHPPPVQEASRHSKHSPVRIAPPRRFVRALRAGFFTIGHTAGAGPQDAHSAVDPHPARMETHRPTVSVG